MNKILDPNLQYMLEKSDEERLSFINKEDIWVNYPVAQKVLEKLDYLMKYEVGKTRVTSILLVGEAHNGKTTLLEHFRKKYPNYNYNLEEERPDWVTSDFFETHSGVARPIIYIQMPSNANEGDLYSEILETINAPFKDRDSLARKKYLVEYYLELFNTDMLIIDEINNLLKSNLSAQRQTLNAIKNLSNALKIPIVLSGIKTSLRAIKTDDQISSRFRPVPLPKWTSINETAQLVATLLSKYPLKESSVITQKTVEQILKISNGYIGNIVLLLRKAASYAIESESEQVTLKEILECDYDIEENPDLRLL